MWWGTTHHKVSHTVIYRCVNKAERQDQFKPACRIWAPLLLCEKLVFSVLTMLPDVSLLLMLQWKGGKMEQKNREITFLWGCQHVLKCCQFPPTLSPMLIYVRGWHQGHQIHPIATTASRISRNYWFCDGSDAVRNRTEPTKAQQCHPMCKGGKKGSTYTPGASSWAPSLHEWWLCRLHGPYLIPLAGTAQRQCDPWAFAPTFSLL